MAARCLNPFLSCSTIILQLLLRRARPLCSNCHLYYACCLLRENCLLSLAEKLLTALLRTCLSSLHSTPSLPTSTCFLPSSLRLFTILINSQKEFLLCFKCVCICLGVSVYCVCPCSLCVSCPCTLCWRVSSCRCSVVCFCLTLILVWLIIATLLWFVAVALGIGRPQRQVVSQQLHDECRVFVGVLVQRVQLCNRVIECLFSQLAGFVGRV